MGELITVSFKRMISLPGYQNMEASVSISTELLTEKAEDDMIAETQEFCASMVLSHLRLQVKQVYERNGLWVGAYNDAMRSLAAPESELVVIEQPPDVEMEEESYVDDEPIPF